MIFEMHDYAAMKDALEALCRFLEHENVPAERVFDSKLAASELVGNVFRHSDGVARLHGEVKDGFVELVVFSTVAYIPPENSRFADVYAEHGRGLFLVDTVCEERTMTENGGIRVRIKIR